METKSTTIIDPFDSDKRMNVEESIDAPWKHWVVVVNPDWTTVWSSIKIDPVYKIADIEEWATYSYFGKTDKDGNRIIMRLTNATNAFRYAKGTTDYATNRTGRASLLYALYS